MICPECNGTGEAPCEFCSGSGCTYCRSDQGVIEAPEIAEEKRFFKEGEVREFRFKDVESADIMVNYLNSRCSFNQFCPEIVNICAPNCVCFKKAYRYPYDGDYKIAGFVCGNPKLTVGAEEIQDILNEALRQYHS